MVGFQMFPHLHPNYVFVTKIPRMLILYFTFLKNNDNSSSNDTVVIESALYVFFCSVWMFLIVSGRWCFLFTENKPLSIFAPWPIFVPFTLFFTRKFTLYAHIFCFLTHENLSICLSCNKNMLKKTIIFATVLQGLKVTMPKTS